jgi:hypothetical protein
MPEPTKKHHIKEIELRFVGPVGKKNAAINALYKLGFVASRVVGEADSWRKSFPELQGNEPGVFLAGARHREGLTQRELAAGSGIPQRHISEMENGKRPIGKKNAKVLATILGADYRAFL